MSTPKREISPNTGRPERTKGRACYSPLSEWHNDMQEDIAKNNAVLWHYILERYI